MGSEQVRVAHKAQEMGWKVKTGTRAAREAHATIAQMKRGSLSVDDLVGEKIEKQKQVMFKKELKSKAHTPIIAMKAKPKKKLHGGAAMKVELDSVMKAAHKALAHSKNNPGDK